MSAQRITLPAVDPAGSSFYRAGGISALVLGLAYVVTAALYAQVGPPPTGGEASLEYFAGRTTVWWGILALSVITDLLFIPVAFSLYLALRDINRNAMLIATAFLGLFVVLDLAVTWSNFASLIALSGDYALASTAQRSADVAAATYASAVIASPLERVYAIVIPSSGILMIGLVMLKGPFGRITAYLALIAGVLGIVSIAGLGVTIIANALITTVWVLLVGYRFYRLGAAEREWHPS